jgi:predicted DNA-binding transcriptional regulator AlpA
VSVYFIQAGPDGDVKIGTAADPVARMAQIQVGCSFRCALVGTLPGDEREEKSFHSRFADLRVRGEWFRFAGALALFLSDTFPALPSNAIAPFAPIDQVRARRLTDPEVLAFAGVSRHALYRAVAAGEISVERAPAPLRKDGRHGASRVYVTLGDIADWRSARRATNRVECAS